MEYFYEISEITKKWINLKFIKKAKNIADPKISLFLYQALPNKYEKIEFIIQKWVEIWIEKFIFFSSERTQKLAINEKKIERFNFIIKESLEQCWWNKFPELIFTDKIDLSLIPWEKLICHTTSGWNFIQGWNNKINLFIWPEWGFSDKEIIEFEKNSCKLINFWERVFRTETAWITVGFHILNSCPVAE